MSIFNPENDQELLYQEYIAARVMYKANKKLCSQLPDNHPEKAENLQKLQAFKNKLDAINKHCLNNIDCFADLMDPELKHSLIEDDIIQLREELKEVKKSLMAMQE